MLTLILTLVGIFVGGVIVDWLHTRFVVAVAAGKKWRSGVFSTAVTLLSVLVWTTVIQHVEVLGISGALALALGAGVGTVLGFHKSV